MVEGMYLQKVCNSINTLGCGHFGVIIKNGDVLYPFAKQKIQRKILEVLFAIKQMSIFFLPCILFY